MTMLEQRPVIAAIVGLGWWGKKMASLVNAGGAEMHFARAVDPNPEARGFADELGLQFSSALAGESVTWFIDSPIDNE